MTHTPGSRPLRLVLDLPPGERPWWHALLGWRGGGVLSWAPEPAALLIWEGPGGERVSIGVERSFALHLSAWPLDEEAGWLGVEIAQEAGRLRWMVAQPWSALPPDLPLLHVEAPVLAPKAWEVLRGILSFHTAALGLPALPRLEPGTWPSAARGLELRRPPPRPPAARVNLDEPARVNALTRNGLKKKAREHHPDQWLLCPRCNAAVKAKNIIRHYDRNHG
jgi:hypothetical protein